MIFKKPYAFFIKNFKLFHLIIFALSAILLYRTSVVYSFFKEYCKTNPNVIGKDLTSALFSTWLYILIVVILIVNIVIIYILIKKEKPYMYYIFNISLYIGVLIVCIISNGIVKDLQEILVAAKTTLAIRDITNIARMLQTISVIFYLIRATGFDIKKFDFVRDLQGLDISEEDSEEIEVALEFEKNVAIRNIKKNARNARYYYIENRFVINIIILLIISATCLLVYLSSNKYDKTYNENDFFNTGTYTIGVKESNIVTKDYKNNTIVSEEYALVVVKVGAKSSVDATLQTSRIVLDINGTRYYSDNTFRNSLIDLGNTYNNENITSELADYLLVYKIPINEINSKMIFKYIDNIKYKRGKTIVNAFNTKLNPNKLDTTKLETKQLKLNEEVKLDNYKLSISNYEIQEKITNTYKQCMNNECFDLKEMIVPSIGEKEKAILKIEGNFEYEEKINNIINLYNFIEKYGSIKYTINGNEYTETNDFKEVQAIKTKQNNVFYIEINKEIINAEKISISFNLRNKTYTYILRGDTSE